MGVGYAMWYEDLYIDGTVYTGNLDANWSIESYGDNETKDYSDIVAAIDGDTLYVTVTNAYPCVTYFVNFDVSNDGTIPFHICDLVCTGPDVFPGTLTITQPTPFQVHPGDHPWVLLRFTC
jgi:hypothetical protein